MLSNITKYKKDLERLTKDGESLLSAMLYDAFPEQCEKEWKNRGKKNWGDMGKTLPKFNEEYQTWYSEAKVLIKQLLPDRISDFEKYYAKPERRKEITCENYRIEDYLQGLHNNQGKIVGIGAASPQFQQQLAILKAVSACFKSSLFDIQALVQADLFDSELEAARNLVEHGFLRASGVIAGVVLEKHLGQVAKNHNIETHKNPTISDFNERLKKDDILDLISWRQIQRLGDIRNLCGHNKDKEPTEVEVLELINGVDKFTKTLF